MMVNNGWVGFGAAMRGGVSVKRYRVSVMRGDIISEAGELPVGYPHSEFQASQLHLETKFQQKKVLGRRVWVESFFFFLRFTG